MSDHSDHSAWPDGHDPDATLTSIGDRASKGGPSPSPSCGRRYRPVHLHARGSLGQVHVARDEELNREVALKELQDHCADDVDTRLRFLREAEITASLEHPCIVPIYGRGNRPDGRPYYAMRLVRGESLDDAIRRYHENRADVLAFRDLLARFVAVCNAIAYAHSRGIIHRDLKPGNVMLGPFGETLVVDWGLARNWSGSDEPPSDEAMPTPVTVTLTSPSATQEGQIVGTPAYMSPEQASGRAVGPASDVYSLGGILYAILTGQSPLPRSLAPLLLMSECGRTPVPPRQISRSVPRALEAVCLKAMAKEPADRYASAAELARDVQRYLADEPVAARREPLAQRWLRWSRRNRSVVVGAAVLLVMGIAGLAGGLWAVSRERDEARRAESRAETEKARAEENALEAKKALDEARLAEQRAETEKTRAERNAAQTKTALDEANRNWQLARKAVDDCFVLATEDVGLSQEAAAPVRRRLLAATLPYYSEFRDRRPGEKDLDLDLARNLTRLARIEGELGNKASALTHANKAAELYSAIAETGDPSAAELQQLADATNDVGSVLHAIGELVRAAEVLVAAHLLQQRTIQKGKTDLRARFHLCKMEHNLGLVESARGRLNEAEGWYDKALRHEAGLLADHPGEVALLGQHVSSWRGRAGLYVRRKRTADADKAYREGEKVGEQLLKRGPAPADAIHALATTFSDHAAMLSNNDKPDQAKPLFLRAISLQEPLYEKFRETRYLYDLGIMTSNLGRVCRLLELLDEEVAAWERARRIWADLAARRPADRNVAAAWVEACSAWGMTKAKMIDRQIQAGDATGAAGEVERLAAEKPPCKPALVDFAAVGGRWLKKFEKETRVTDTQRRRMRELVTSLLQQAKREGMLDARAREWIQKERSFDLLRNDEAFEELMKEPKPKER